jgi:ATP-dependent Clp protease ATP-binding subunit ClpB
MEKHSVARLIGAPPGYVGYEEGGYLTEAVRRRPYSVILLDEVEKAHPDVFNVLLQVLDDGRLTDGQGRTVDFRNCIIVMTSNIASEYIQQLAEQQAEHWEIEARLKDALKQHFRPEFLNRIDEVIVFQSLTREDIKAIVGIQLGYLAERLAERNVSIELTDDAKDLLGELGWDPTFGARPLRRVIQQKVENDLARRMLSGEIRDGARVTVDAEGKSFAFEVDNPETRQRAAAPTAGEGEPDAAETVEGEIVEEEP